MTLRGWSHRLPVVFPAPTRLEWEFPARGWKWGSRRALYSGAHGEDLRFSKEFAFCKETKPGIPDARKD